MRDPEFVFWLECGNCGDKLIHTNLGDLAIAFHEHTVNDHVGNIHRPRGGALPFPS